MRRAVAALGLCLLLTGCASAQEEQAREPRITLEANETRYEPPIEEEAATVTPEVETGPETALEAPEALEPTAAWEPVGAAEPEPTYWEPTYAEVGQWEPTYAEQSYVEPAHVEPTDAGPAPDAGYSGYVAEYDPLYNEDGPSRDMPGWHDGYLETYYDASGHYMAGEWELDDEGFYRDSDGRYIVGVDIADTNPETGQPYQYGDVVETGRGEAVVYDFGSGAKVHDFATAW